MTAPPARRGRGGRLTGTEIAGELEQWNAMKELNHRGAR